MNALSIVNKVVSLVSYDMHKSRLNAVTACVKSLLSGSAATVTSIGRGIIPFWKINWSDRSSS